MTTTTASVPDELDDTVIIGKIARGEVSALATLYDRYAGLLLSMAHRMLGDKTMAEDLVQDVFMEVWRRADAFEAGRGSVRTWMLVRLRSRVGSPALGPTPTRSHRGRREPAMP